MERALVTGASGFIGRHLRRALRDLGVEVHCTTRRRPTTAVEATERWWEVDLGNRDAVAATLESSRPDVVFHLAGEVTGARGREALWPTFRGNLLATVTLLDALGDGGDTGVVIASSMEEPALGDGASPGSPYAASKVAATAYTRMFAQLYDTPAILTRIFLVYGPDESNESHLIPSTILSLLDGAAPAIGSGRRRIDWIYVDDVVAGLIAAAGATAEHRGQSLDLGSGTRTSIRSTVELLSSLVDRTIEPRFGALPDRPFDHERIADVATTTAALGWKPAVDLEEGLTRTVDWYRRQRAAG
jgi:nucleoside-diphosphate-sugar epimerase